jgi:hypothetical protein
MRMEAAGSSTPVTFQAVLPGSFQPRPPILIGRQHFPIFYSRLEPKRHNLAPSLGQDWAYPCHMHIASEYRKRGAPFLRGMAAVVYYPSIRHSQREMSGGEADMMAMRSDWVAIGLDMQRAIRAYEEEP